MYGHDNYIWGTVGYSGFNGEMNGRDMQFGQGMFRFKPDGSGFEYVTGSTNNTWGLGFSETFDVFGSTANNDPSFYVAIPNRYFEGVQGLPMPPGGGRGVGAGYQSAAQFYNAHLITPVHPAGGRVRRLHGGRRPSALHGALVPEAVLEPHRVHHRADRAPGRPGRSSKSRAPGSSRATAGTCSPAPRSGSRRCRRRSVPTAQCGSPTGTTSSPSTTRRRRTSANGAGNAYETSMRDESRGRIYRVVYRNAPPAQKLVLSRNEPPACSRRSSSDNMMWRLHAQRLLIERGQKDVVPQLIALVQQQVG